jgi:hypothetical protein
VSGRLNIHCLRALCQDLADQGFTATAEVTQENPHRAELDELTALDRERIDLFLSGYDYAAAEVWDAEDVAAVAREGSAHVRPEVVPPCWAAQAEESRRLDRRRSTTAYALAILALLMLALSISIGNARTEARADVTGVVR